MKAFLLLLFVCCGSLAAAAKPNVVVILSDDFGYGSAGAYGADPNLVQTPSLDRLAREGRRFTDANTTSSVCSPTRYSVLTGRYCWRTSLKHEVLSTFAPLHIEPGRLNLASLLKKHGYATAAVGKWHLGYGTADDSPQWRTDYTKELSPGPLDIGFDYHFSVPSNHGDLTGVYVENRRVYGLGSRDLPNADDYQTTYTAEDMENAKGKGILDLEAPRRKNVRVMKVLTDKASDWLRAQPKDQPFFLYFTPVAVHNPVTPDTDIARKSKAGPFGDWIHELDRSVGRILTTLDEMGATENTLVIFTSDNGGVNRPENTRLLQTAAIQAGLKVNGPWRGGKHDVWEGGFRVPFLVRWPGQAPAGSVSGTTVSVADILATTAAIVGEPLPQVSQGAEDSRNFLSAILGEPEKPIRDDIIVHSADGVFAIRKGKWKWIEGIPVDEIKPALRKLHANQFRSQLYDIEADPAEAKDLSAEHPDVVAELTALLNRYRYGGYSRELPPADVQPPQTAPITLAPVKGTVLLNESLAALPAKPWQAAAGTWEARDGGLWGSQTGKEDLGANLRVPFDFMDGTLECDISFHGANRTSCRMESTNGERKGNFRIEISRTAIGLTKNPATGEPKEAVEPIARRAMELDADKWYPVRITFQGNEAIVQVNETILRGTHPVLGERKTGANFLVFGASAGFRNVRLVR